MMPVLTWVGFSVTHIRSLDRALDEGSCVAFKVKREPEITLGGESKGQGNPQTIWVQLQTGQGGGWPSPQAHGGRKQREAYVHGVREGCSRTAQLPAPTATLGGEGRLRTHLQGTQDTLWGHRGRPRGSRCAGMSFKCELSHFSHVWLNVTLGTPMSFMAGR